MALLRGETVTRQTDWFTLQDARLQLKPYSEPNIEVAVAASISPTGAKAAGKYGTGLLSIAATTKQGFDAIGTHWQTWNDVAAQHGHTAEREVATRRADAPRGDEGAGAPTSRTASCRSRSTSPTCCRPGRRAATRPEEIIANIDEDGFAVIGTPDDAIAKIQSLVDESGGFGTFLLFGHDWASPAATKHSFELFAQYVMPHFTGQLERPQASCDWVTGSGGEFVNRAIGAITKAITDYADEQQATS